MTRTIDCQPTDAINQWVLLMLENNLAFWAVKLNGCIMAERCQDRNRILKRAPCLERIF